MHSPHLAHLNERGVVRLDVQSHSEALDGPARKQDTCYCPLHVIIQWQEDRTGQTQPVDTPASCINSVQERPSLNALPLTCGSA